MQAGKNKKLTYLLICAVAGVWGVILYRVFFNEQAEDYSIRTTKSVMKEEGYDQYLQKADTFRLALNYRDPFFGDVHVEPDPAVGQAIQVSLAPPPPIPPPINWGIIKYSGYIVNPQTKKTVSIVNVNGRERMMDEGELFEGVKLLKNRKDSILVGWQGKQKYIKQ